MIVSEKPYYKMNTWEMLDFLDNIEFEDDCWIWIGGKSKNYGKFCIKNKPGYLAHRLMYMYHNGVINVNYVIHHTCSNRACVNPNHLKAMGIKAHSALHNK